MGLLMTARPNELVALEPLVGPPQVALGIRKIVPEHFAVRPARPGSRNVPDRATWTIPFELAPPKGRAGLPSTSQDGIVAPHV